MWFRNRWLIIKNPYQKPVKIRINQVNFFKHIKKTKWMHHEPIRILLSLQFIWSSNVCCNKLPVINSAGPILMCPFGISTCRWTAIPIQFLVLYICNIMLSVRWYFGISNTKESLIIYYWYYPYLLSRHFHIVLFCEISVSVSANIGLFFTKNLVSVIPVYAICKSKISILPIYYKLTQH